MDKIDEYRYAFQVPVPASHQFVLDPLDAKVTSLLLSLLPLFLILINRQTISIQDGFVHLSTAPQLLPILSRFFSTSESIILVKIDYARLSGFKVVKWEKDGGSVDGEGGQEYPHLYRYLEGEYVDSSKEINRAEGEEGEKGGWEKALREQEELGWLEC